MTDKPFILVDGSSYLFRAYHALPPLTNSQGQPTGAIVGVINMLKKLVDEYQPDYMAVVFDTPGKTFRDDLYSEYKANRPPAPEDLKTQIKPLHDIIQAMGLPLLLIEGVEADDVIGTLADQASKLGMNTLVSTGDKDMAQLVDKHVTLINTMSDTTMDRQGVFEKFSVWPEQIIDYLALMGDTVDNIPGVHKCGPKTAAKWLAEHETLDAVMANAEQVKGKIGEYLREALSQLPLSKELTTIKRDVELDVAPRDLTPAQADKDKLRELYAEIEARRLLADLENNAGESVEKVSLKVADADYETVLDEQSFEKWMKKLSSAQIIAFDTETTSLNYMQAELVGVSFSLAAGKAAYVPVSHQYP
ncbi:MAG: DNA polymerase I, partial [Gammaproteobacteria bacterium]|nr:DNA polymerase I [Gammaproteobacteria bacterium]